MFYAKGDIGPKFFFCHPYRLLIVLDFEVILRARIGGMRVTSVPFNATNLCHHCSLGIVNTTFDMSGI